MAMSASDRNELRRILKAREALLQEQIYQRENELQNRVREEIEARNEDRLQRGIKRLEEFRTKVQELTDEAFGIQKEFGIATRYGGIATFQLAAPDTITLTDTEKEIRQVITLIKEKSGAAKMDISLKFLELQQELAVGALQSPESTDFLARIPTVDTLLPLEGIKTAIAEITEGK